MEEEEEDEEDEEDGLLKMTMFLTYKSSLNGL